MFAVQPLPTAFPIRFLFDRLKEEENNLIGSKRASRRDRKFPRHWRTFHDAGYWGPR